MKPPLFGIVANIGKQRVATLLPNLLKWLVDQGIGIIVASDLEQLMSLDGYETALPNDLALKADIVLSFGGDGTFLQTARLVSPHETPIIGVNLGDFGYLAEINVSELRERVKEILEGKYRHQERMMLEAVIEKDRGKEIYYGLNDVVVDKGGFPRTISLETKVNGFYLNSFKADGLIVATPTGSTGYSLSVGGPILEPTTDGLIINPISPHMLANRPVVVSGDSEIEMTAVSGEIDSFQVAIDGQKTTSLSAGDRIRIKRASFVTRLIVFEGYNFYAVLRNKLHWRNQMETH